MGPYHIGNERAAVPLLFFSGHLRPIFRAAVPARSIRLLNQPSALHLPVRKARAFTLIEIVISVFILMLLIMLAVPSLTGVMADRRLRHSLDSFNSLVYQAQERSLGEHRPYLLVWTTNSVELRPEITVKGDDPKPAATLPIARGESFLTETSVCADQRSPAGMDFLAEWDLRAGRGQIYRPRRHLVGHLFAAERTEPTFSLCPALNHVAPLPSSKSS